MFEEHPEWWDILCNITTGKVTVNPNLITDIPEKYVVCDNELMAEVRMFGFCVVTRCSTRLPLQ